MLNKLIIVPFGLCWAGLCLYGFSVEQPPLIDSYRHLLPKDAENIKVIKKYENRIHETYYVEFEFDLRGKHYYKSGHSVFEVNP